MNERDRLAADITCVNSEWLASDWLADDAPDPDDFVADRLIALGWTRLDEERLDRAMAASGVHVNPTPPGPTRPRECESCQKGIAKIAKAYREDTEPSFDRERFDMETAQLKAGMRFPGEESDNWPAIEKAKAYREDTE